MKKLNHQGSAVLLVLTLLLATLMALSALGLNGDWKPKTTPYRLVNEPFIGWSLIVVLTVGLVLIRKGPELLQCVSALVFVGVIFGLAMASAFFWDGWLGPILANAAAPMLRSAVMTLKSLLPLGSLPAAAEVRLFR
ncbi:MAG TPA: hypothetical protein VIN03_05300 [Roseateles sp.]